MGASSGESSCARYMDSTILSENQKLPMFMMTANTRAMRMPCRPPSALPMTMSTAERPAMSRSVLIWLVIIAPQVEWQTGRGKKNNHAFSPCQGRKACKVLHGAGFFRKGRKTCPGEEGAAYPEENLAARPGRGAFLGARRKAFRLPSGSMEAWRRGAATPLPAGRGLRRREGGDTEEIRKRGGGRAPLPRVPEKDSSSP